MKKKTLLGFFFSIASLLTHSQDSIKVPKIDSTIHANEFKISIVYQKTEKNGIETLHGKDPEKITDIYRFSEAKSLISYSRISFSPGDTDIIINLYLDSNVLIKVKTISFDLNNNKSEFIYYFYNNELINKEAEMTGIHRGSYYVEYAKRILKKLNKRPIRFPS